MTTEKPTAPAAEAPEPRPAPWHMTESTLLMTAATPKEIRVVTGHPEWLIRSV